MNTWPPAGALVRFAAAGLDPFPPRELLLKSAGVTVFTGRFGSGKTETAINYALLRARALSREVQEGSFQPEASPFPQRQRPPNVLLIDLDIVTPYFRSRDLAGSMQEAGLTVLSPAREGHQLDVPAITPELLGAIQQAALPVVIDVGGDRQGARALGQFSAEIARHRSERGVHVYFVVNPYRPFTGTLDGLAASISEIEASSRLAVTGLVSNPNLMAETTLEVLLEGHAQVESFAHSLELPIAFVCLERTLALRLDAYGESALWKQNEFHSLLSQPILILHRHFAMSWERDGVTVA